VYVGDNPHRDFAGARALGIRTVRVLTGEHARAEAAAGDESDFVVAAAADVPALLG
jgi:putative hydrolase of the HAD superfamily